MWLKHRQIRENATFQRIRQRVNKHVQLVLNIIVPQKSNKYFQQNSIDGRVFMRKKFFFAFFSNFKILMFRTDHNECYFG